MRIPRLLSWPLRLAARLAKALRYYTRLRYSWHLSWVKAER
jgi:hypothetical protein